MCIRDSYKILEEFYENENFNEGRKKMAKMPEHAKLIPNPKTFAAGFYVENVFVLPGVPSILQAMLPQLNNIIKTGKKILSSSIDTNLRESQISEQLSKLQDKYKNIDIGSYPYFKEKPGTILVLRSTEKDLLKRCEEDVKKLVSSLK